MKIILLIFASAALGFGSVTTPPVVEALRAKAAARLQNAEFHWNILAERSTENAAPKISDLVGPKMPMESAKESYTQADSKDLPYDAAIGFTCDVSTGSSAHDNLLAIFYYPSAVEESTLYLFPIGKRKKDIT